MPYQSTSSLYDGGDEDEGLLGRSNEAERFQPVSSSCADGPSGLAASITSRHIKYAAVILVAVLCLALVIQSSSLPSSSTHDATDLPGALDLPERVYRRHYSHSHSSSYHSSRHGANGDDSDDDSGPEDGGEQDEKEDDHRSGRERGGHERDSTREQDDEPRHSHPRHSSPRSHHTSSESATSVTVDTRSAVSPLVGNNPKEQSPDQRAAAGSKGTSPLTEANCEPPYPGYPYCESKVNELQQSWNKDPETEAKYRAAGVDGGKCSFLTYLNKNGFYCPEAADYNRGKIRGVNLGGWLVLEPWIRPSLFTQFAVEDGVVDQWTFCEKLGKTEAKRQLEAHWDSWLSKAELQELVDGGINHVRIPVGYWILGDVQDDEPWVTGDLAYLERGLRWCAEVGLHAILDLHCAPGSQNGFDNSGRMGDVHFADSETESNGRVRYPNIDRALATIDALTSHFSAEAYKGTVVGIELVNEAFISIPLEIVKDYYVQGYERVKKYGDLAVIIGDSFRFGSWGEFMYPPHYRHVWIDTHIYQVFDAYRLSFSWQQHIDQTCKINKPEVAVAPLSTMVGEWSLATVDCARWLNGFGRGARYDGTYTTGKERAVGIGSCKGQNDIHDSTVWTPEYRAFLRQFAEVQMDAYESGSSAGWFFWNFKTDGSPQWDYLLGLREGWLPKDHNNRKSNCDNSS